LPAISYDMQNEDRRDVVVAFDSGTGTSASGQNSSSIFDSLPSSSFGLTPDDRSGSSRNRSPSAMSLEWEDEMAEAAFKRSPLSADRHHNRKSPFRLLDLMEYLRLYYNVDDLNTLPKVYEIGRKLTKRGYRRVLIHNEVGCLHDISPGTSSRGDGALDNLIIATVIGAAHFRLPIFKCQSFRIVPEAVDASMKRCSFFAERCSTYFGSTTPEGTRAYILQCMQKLWQLHESVQQDELQSNVQCEFPSTSAFSLITECMNELVDGMKVLMALRSLETYEEILFTRRTPFPFYTDLFRVYTPATYAEQKLFRPVTSSSSSPSPADMDDLDIALLADTLSIRIELFRPHSPHPEFVAVYPELEHNANINRPRLPLLEPGVASGLFLPLV